ncbi:MAG: hypothetical protein KatS3mg068_2499 [Candidatus Sericytochromatia bacterium]|nr:MAG: hypothetical protein KatS3mg068_2499 [Candidatus Sericytochromatia bacterium]
MKDLIKKVHLDMEFLYKQLPEFDKNEIDFCLSYLQEKSFIVNNQISALGIEYIAS